MWNKAKAILLNSNKEIPEINDLVLTAQTKELVLMSDEDILEYLSSESLSSKIQDLYIINDDVIKEGDLFLYWFIGQLPNEGKIGQCKNKQLPKCNRSKIIATNNKSLTQVIDKAEIPLSQIPHLFIEQYITEYNKGNISDVLVECCKERFKIKTTKDSFSRSELTLILNKFGSKVYGEYTRNETMEDFTYKWIEQNI